MHFLKRFFLILFLLQSGCGSGGPLTPVQSFNDIKHAVEKNDSDAIAGLLTVSSLEKMNKLNMLIKEMRKDQLELLSVKYGYSQEKLKNLRVADCVYLYFFSDVTGVRLNRFFEHGIITVDIKGNRASVKTENGVDLYFLREGPYWKFDLSDL